VKNPDGTYLAGASVQLYKTDLTYDTTLTTTAYGQAFFTPLDASTYNLVVSKAGFTNYSGEINVNGQTKQTISLATS